MKNSSSFVVLFLILFILTGLSYSQDSSLTNSKITSKDIEKNLIVGVETENLGLKVSSTYYLGGRKSSMAVIPLMNVLHTVNSEEARIIAALYCIKKEMHGVFMRFGVLPNLMLVNQ